MTVTDDRPVACGHVNPAGTLLCTRQANHYGLHTWETPDPRGKAAEGKVWPPADLETK